MSQYGYHVRFTSASQTEEMFDWLDKQEGAKLSKNKGVWVLELKGHTFTDAELFNVLVEAESIL